LSEPPTRNREFAAIVERLAAGRSNRVLADITRVNATSIGDMRWGRVVGYRLLGRFADGIEASPEDRRELFAAAGYADEDWNPDAALVAGIRVLQDEFGPFQWSSEVFPLSRATPEEIDALLATMRRDLEKRRK